MRLIAGSAGPCIAGGVAAMLAQSIGVAAVQGGSRPGRPDYGFGRYGFLVISRLTTIS